MCRAITAVNHTIGFTTPSYAILLDDKTGVGFAIDGDALVPFEGIYCAADLHDLIGTRTGTIARLDGGTILYGAVADTTPTVLDCFFETPALSINSRATRRERRQLAHVHTTTIAGDIMPLSVLMARLVFPVVVIDVIEDEDLEFVDTNYMEPA